MNPKVSLIVLNWNGWKDTIECLESLHKTYYTNYDIVLVDNASTDASIKKIREYTKGEIKVNSKCFENDQPNKPWNIFEFSLKEISDPEFTINGLKHGPNLIIIQNDKNYGFAEGNNIGIEFTKNILKPDYIMLLNNDTIVKNDFLSKLVAVAEKNSEIAIVGPKNYYYLNGCTKKISMMGGYINWMIYPGYHGIEQHQISKFGNSILEVDWITGASLMIRFDLMHNLYLNEHFFFGSEDVDLCIKIKKRGYKIILVPESIIWHKLSVSRQKKYKNFIDNLKHDIRSTKKLLEEHQRHYLVFFMFYLIQIPLLILKAYLEKVFLFISI